ncbi:MAG: ribose-phosphate diphosphokinase [Candidatus Hodarchaeales archaeon]
MEVTLIGKSSFAGKIAKTVSSSSFIEIEERLFPDGEICPRLLLNDNIVRGKHAFIAMQLTQDQPKNQYLVSLLWTIYNVRRLKPGKISCIMPYHLYSRQDRESRKGEPVSSKYLAIALESAGIKNFVTINSHTYGKTDINKYFLSSKGTDLSALSLLGNKLTSLISSPEETVCLAPDEGALFLAQEVAEAMNSPFFSAIKKVRDLNTGKITQKMADTLFKIKDKTVIIIDDLVSSGKTMVGAAQIAKNMGAKEIIFAYIHAVHSSTGFSIMQEEDPSFILSTDTIKTKFKGIKTVSVIPLICTWIQENI